MLQRLEVILKTFGFGWLVASGVLGLCRVQRDAIKSDNSSGEYVSSPSTIPSSYSGNSKMLSNITD